MLIGDGEFANIESDPSCSAGLWPEAPAAPPAPTVTDIGLAGTVNFVPQGNEVLYPPAPPPPCILNRRSWVHHHLQQLNNLLDLDQLLVMYKFLML
jgi:hypothetical protein